MSSANISDEPDETTPRLDALEESSATSTSGATPPGTETPDAPTDVTDPTSLDEELLRYLFTIC